MRCERFTHSEHALWTRLLPHGTHSDTPPSDFSTPPFEARGYREFHQNSEFHPQILTPLVVAFRN